ncbi:MAG: NTP transferase domain-containing protein [Chitinophagaceae bacterium]|nr:NTP transferase domain-containing protein [Chitinophagaceae bacterium]
MKAIIPVAGAGTRLRPHTNTQPKALIPLAGKTLLSIIVDQLREAGIEEFVFVIGHLGDKITDYVKKKYPALRCHFILQTERLGLGHAIYLTREAVGADEVFIVLGDTICEYDIKDILYRDESMLGVKKVDDPRGFGVAEVDADGIITRVVEKPQIPKSNLALVGIYKIKDTTFLFNCLEKNIGNGAQAGEDYYFTDALQCMIAEGVVFHSFKVRNWFDCGRIETLLESNATLMKKSGGYIAADHLFENVVIIPPVSIGSGCEISNSILGPNVAIGEQATISYSVVKDSIIGDFAGLNDVVLQNSVIGSDTLIKGETRTLNIGDNTQIELG